MTTWVLCLALTASAVLASPVHNGPPPFEGTWEDIFNPRSVEAPFKDHKVYKIVPETEGQVEWLEALREDSSEEDLDFWGEPVIGRELFIHVFPAVEEAFLEGLKMFDLEFDVQVQDLQLLVDAERESNVEATRFARFLFGGNDIHYKSAVGRYALSEDIFSTMDDLAAKYSHMSILNIGKSFQGKALYIAKFSTGEGKPAMFINSGMHSREWIAHATVVYIIEQMCTRYGKSKKNDVTDLLNKFDVYLMPLVNPDGYDYSINSMSKRFWRKTVSKHPKSKCLGCDPNRNWDIGFGGEGTSDNPCSDIYRGPNAFSEPETKALSIFLTSIKDDLVSYYDIHAFSQLWMENFGYAKDTYAPDFEETHRVALIGAKAIESVNGLHFTVGTPPQLMYAAAGGAYDWAKKELGVKYSYALELRPLREAGMFGFLVPASQISDSGREVLHGLAAAGNEMQV